MSVDIEFDSVSNILFGKPSGSPRRSEFHRSFYIRHVHLLPKRYQAHHADERAAAFRLRRVLSFGTDEDGGEGGPSILFEGTQSSPVRDLLHLLAPVSPV